MSIQEQKITEAAIAANGVQSRPDKLTGTAAQNKKVFDNLVTAVVRERFNALLDELTGTGAAGQLGITTVPGFSADNIQAALEQIVTAMQEITQGSVADGSIGLAKLAAEVTAAALGGAAASHTHGAGDVSSGVLDAARIPVLDGAKLGEGSVGTEQLAPAAVTGEKLAALAVLPTHLAQGAVTAQKLADGAVTPAKIGAGAVQTTHIGANVITRAKMAADAYTLADNAGAHNAVYGGRNLGSSVTAAQWAAIETATFTDIFSGDYWEINGIIWRIAGLDYYYNTGDVLCTTHHAVIVPDTSLYEAAMNSSQSTTGGFVASTMYTSGLAQALTMAVNAFGADHILTHRQIFCNAVTNGVPSGYGFYDNQITLMTEQNVFGGKFYGAAKTSSQTPTLMTLDNAQFPMFAHNHALINVPDKWVGLRDIVSAASYARVTSRGSPDWTANITNPIAVRPVFCIKA